MHTATSLQRVSRALATASLAPVLALVGGFTLSSNRAIADSAGPFAKFLGSWGGAGQVAGVNGSVEKIRCRATYSTPSNERSLSQSLVCASDSYRIQIHSYVIAEAQSVEGHWEEATRQVTGHLAGTIADGRFEGTVSGAAFSASLSLNTTGRKQTVAISPQGGDIAHVTIVLSRDE
jgi:hypothetical protein